jgi:hypothetical protein
MKKLVSESLDESLGQRRIYENSAGEQISPDEFISFVGELIAMDDKEKAIIELKKLFAANPYMHEELGEVRGRNKYKKGMDMFAKYYFDFESTNTDDDILPEEPVKETVIDRSGWIDPEEAKKLFMDCIRRSQTPEDAKKNVHEIFNSHPYIHEELGEIEGRDYYKKAADALIAAFDAKFNMD